MLNRIARFFVGVCERWMPDPFLFCILLTAGMLQPFWALPILSIARLSIRDIMGYCVMTFLLSFALSTLVLWLLV